MCPAPGGPGAARLARGAPALAGWSGVWFADPPARWRAVGRVFPRTD